MGHKLFTACGCGVECQNVALIPAEQNNGESKSCSGKYSRCSREKNSYWVYRVKAVRLRLHGGNLNAYNVLMQQGIVKPEDYSNNEFTYSMKNHICEKPLANHANKKAAGD
jgi:hypothetical protein